VNVGSGSRKIGIRSLAGIGAMALYLGFVAAGRELRRPAPETAPIPGRLSIESKAASDQRAREALAEASRHLAEVEAVHGPDSLEVARVLSDMAELRWGLEEYAAERPLVERALAIRQKLLGEEDPDVASSLYQMAEVRRATGDYAGAMRYHRRVIAIWEKTRGPEDPGVATSLHYLGVVSLRTGDRAQAKACLDRALAIRERRLGPNDGLVATTLTALAELSLQAGDAAAAEPLLARAQSIWEQAFGPGHPFVARTLTSRAALQAQAGHVAEARQLLERALAIRTRTFGADHYLVARSMVDIANLMASTGGSEGGGADGGGAEALYLRALAIQRRNLGPVHPEVAETLAALARLRWRLGRIEPALEDTLQAEALARDYFRRSARDLSDGEALQYEAIRLSGLDVALSILASGRRGKVVSDADVRRIAEEVIRSRAIVLDERARARRAPAQETSPPGLREVLDALPATSALLSYVKYRDLGAGGGEPEAAYLALVFRPGSDMPAAIPLGAAAAIEDAISGWRGQVSADPRSQPPGAGEQKYHDAGRRLREAIWDPLQPALEGMRQVLVVPDGAINLVALATLPTAPGRYLAETGPLIHYLSAERDLVLDRVAQTAGAGVLVVGDPDFDAGSPHGLPSGAARGAASGLAADAARHAAEDAAPLCSEFAELSFDPLPGARAEAEEVESLWAPRTAVLRLTGAQADEATFKERAPGRRILHLATHAFVLSDRCGSTRTVPDLSAETAFIGDRPLLRSGLALAGANRRGDTSDDGILTAEEIAGLDLSGVEWAVLSGCDTGAGRIQMGEGVVGLRRAFEVAGARTLIMSLWAVDDGAARVWMRNLYEQRLAGRSTAEAVRGAGLRILNDQRARGRTTHPYYWGGFVAAGDWR
jgi:CHAT domain-containing protein/tetratricopeptide (TPR) repeat protein